MIFYSYCFQIKLIVNFSNRAYVTHSVSRRNYSKCGRYIPLQFLLDTKQMQAGRSYSAQISVKIPLSILNLCEKFKHYLRTVEATVWNENRHIQLSEVQNSAASNKWECEIQGFISNFPFIPICSWENGHSVFCLVCITWILHFFEYVCISPCVCLCMCGVCVSHSALIVGFPESCSLLLQQLLSLCFM